MQHLFLPPQQILERIGFSEQAVAHFSIFNELGVYDFMSARYSELQINTIYDYYKFRQRFAHDKAHIGHKIVLPSHEAIKNSLEHGIPPIVHGIIIGDEGVCCYTRDNGDYFADERIKRQYENRIPIREFADENKAPPCHIGVNNYIFAYTDDIVVDTNTRTLYLLNYHPFPSSDPRPKKKE
jgi:hypothetical protein